MGSREVSEDRVIRAITEDSAFRIIAVEARSTAQGVLAAQSIAEHALAGLFAELVVGAVLVRETMSPDMRVQGFLRLSGGKGQLVADSHPEGMTRGLVTLREGAEREPWLGEGSALQLMRVLYNGELAQGVVEPTRDGGISQALTQYMLVSEQIASTIGVGAVIEGGQVQWAGGLIVQVLPEAEEEALERMLARIESLGDLESWLEERAWPPAQMLREFLGEVPHVVLDSSAVFAGCNCDKLRVLGALSTLGREEIEDIIATGEVLEIDCDYCGTSYKVGPESLRGLLGQPD